VGFSFIAAEERRKDVSIAVLTKAFSASRGIVDGLPRRAVDTSFFLVWHKRHLKVIILISGSSIHFVHFITTRLLEGNILVGSRLLFTHLFCSSIGLFQSRVLILLHCHAVIHHLGVVPPWLLQTLGFLWRYQRSWRQDSLLILYIAGVVDDAGVVVVVDSSLVASAAAGVRD